MHALSDLCISSLGYVPATKSEEMYCTFLQKFCMKCFVPIRPIQGRCVAQSPAAYAIRHACNFCESNYPCTRPRTKVAPHVDDQGEGVADPDRPSDPVAVQPVAVPDLHVALGRRQREVNRVGGVHPEIDLFESTSVRFSSRQRCILESYVLEFKINAIFGTDLRESTAAFSLDRHVFAFALPTT